MNQPTKVNEATNKELADWIETHFIGGKHAEIARRLRELPDPAPPTPTLEDELRELVEKHECFKGVLECHDSGGYRWWIDKKARASSWLSPSRTLTVVRGIVKAMCDERGSDWAWKPREQSNHATHTPSKKWIVWAGDMLGSFATTELAAIDALLTVMEGTR